LLCLTTTKHAAVPMATTSRASTRTSLQLPRPIEPIKPLASEPCGPQTANLPLLAPTLHLFARASCSKQRRPPQPNLHSPNSRPAVQCNEGFCNAPERSALDLDYKHGVAETSPYCESAHTASSLRGTDLTADLKVMSQATPYRRRCASATLGFPARSLRMLSARSMTAAAGTFFMQS
jgi:hypothetical protein